MTRHAARPAQLASRPPVDRGRALEIAILALAPLAAAGASAAADGNRLAHLDGADPFHASHRLARLVTPQWIGESGVDAVVILAIDDMRDPARYEAFLSPIINRLQRIDGRAPVSIMTNTLRPDDPQLQRWLAEGLSLETHTIDHPCPLLGKDGLAGAKSTYDRCVDLLASVPGNRPVAFRVPCMDSLNTPSPRFYSEIFARKTPAGNFLAIDSSVPNVFTAADPDLPRELVLDADGRARFAKYLPSTSFVAYIEDYPYPYVIGRSCWQLPCVVPSDWEGQKLHGPNSPATVRDLEAALDAAVIKQGTFTLVFHPHGWMRSDQVVELIDHAVATHGTRVKFLNFREALARLTEHLLGGEPLRAADGGESGVRVLDVDNDGFMDAVIANERVRRTRRWMPAAGGGSWSEGSFPLELAARTPGAGGARFAVTSAGGGAALVVRGDGVSGAWTFRDGGWREEPGLLGGLEVDGRPLQTVAGGKDSGVRFRDIDGDGISECLAAGPHGRGAWRWDAASGRWSALPFQLPQDVLITGGDGSDRGLRFADADGDGHEDLVYSNESSYSAYLLTSMTGGWSQVVASGLRGAPPSIGREIPAIVRGEEQNGAWFRNDTLWVQNESTAGLPDHVDRLSFADLLSSVDPAPKSPQAALALFRTAPGFAVELVASEPEVLDPVAFDWGADGRLWVVEMADYPLGIDGNGAPGGRVVALDDADGGGTYKRSAVFLDGLSFPTSVHAWRGGVLVTAAGEIIYAEDTDGDGRADLKRTLYSGFGEGNQQHRANTLAWGLDNWIHVANGDSGGSIRSHLTGEEVRISGRDLRIRPQDGGLDVETGQTQYGRARDDWGNWFGCSNPNPIFHFVLADEYLRRNPHVAPPPARHDVAPPAGQVFPTSRTLPRYNDLHMANRFTSCCGLTLYRDDLFDLDGILGPLPCATAFVSEPAHNLVHRMVLEPSGVTFTSRRAPGEERSEFLSSSDHWFRPTSLRVGPDGALWVADMYRKVIEHPQYFYLGGPAAADVRAGEDRGRIWRVVPVGRRPRPIPRLAQLGPDELVAALESPSGWIRDKAQELLVENAAPGAPTRALAALLRASRRPAARLHALAALDGLGALSPADVRTLLDDPHPGVRRHAARLAEPFLNGDDELGRAIAKLAQDSDPFVRLQAAYSLGAWQSPEAGRALARLAVANAGDPYITAAALSSATSNYDAMLAELLALSTPGATGDSVGRLAGKLLPMAAASGRPEALARAFEALVSAAGRRRPEWHFLSLASLLDSVATDSGTSRGAALEALAAARTTVDGVFLAARETAADPGAPLSLRIAAVTLLGSARPGERDAQADAGAAEPPAEVNLLAGLLGTQSAPELQSAAIASLARSGHGSVASLVLAGWRGHAPGLRRTVLDTLLSRRQWAGELLAAIEQGTVQRAEIDAQRRRRLLDLIGPTQRERGELALEVTAESDAIAAAMARLAPARGLQGDSAAGAKVFTLRCSPCHQLGSTGHAVGPDLAALADKSLDALLVAIADPNRGVEDKFVQYTAVTQDGLVSSGVIREEGSTSVTLAAQDGKETVLLRRDLLSFESSGKSLMPEGLEKDITPQELANLVAVLREAYPAPKSFPANAPAVVRPDASGVLELSATSCEVYGSTLVFEQNHRNLGFWSSADDQAVWRLELSRAHTYDVELEWACDEECAGGRVVVQAGESRLAGTVASTGTWETYKRTTLGRLELAAGASRIVVRSEGAVPRFLMDLKSLRLRPAE